MASPESEGPLPAKRHGRRIVVVGHCASGKSTLVESLREHGYDAYVAAQEHSEIPALWAHLRPDLIVALSISAQGVRRRRTPSWPDWLHDTQTRRLNAAYLAADLIVDTDELDQQAVLRTVLTFLETK